MIIPMFTSGINEMGQLGHEYCNSEYGEYGIRDRHTVEGIVIDKTVFKIACGVQFLVGDFDDGKVLKFTDPFFFFVSDFAK